MSVLCSITFLSYFCYRGEVINGGFGLVLDGTQVGDFFKKVV